jgi:hypothetical protein
MNGPNGNTTIVTPSSITASTNNSNHVEIHLSKKNRNRPDLASNLIGKYRSQGLDIVAEFLDTKARKSRKTSLLYSTGVRYLNRYIEQNYNGKNLFTK